MTNRERAEQYLSACGVDSNGYLDVTTYSLAALLDEAEERGRAAAIREIVEAVVAIRKAGP